MCLEGVTELYRGLPLNHTYLRLILGLGYGLGYRLGRGVGYGLLVCCDKVRYSGTYR